MDTYWKNDPNDGTDEELWEHEWATHGTCISTLDPSCYTNYQSEEEAADFFKTVVNLFQTLPTYTVSMLNNVNQIESSSLIESPNSGFQTQASYHRIQQHIQRPKFRMLLSHNSVTLPQSNVAVELLIRFTTRSTCSDPFKPASLWPLILLEKRRTAHRQELSTCPSLALLFLPLVLLLPPLAHVRLPLVPLLLPLPRRVLLQPAPVVPCLARVTGMLSTAGLKMDVSLALELGTCLAPALPTQLLLVVSTYSNASFTLV
jgi:hypothetical protein